MGDGKLAIQPADQWVKDLFLTAFYEVPDFQREYVWRAKKEVQRLIEDLIQAYREDESDYFLGSVVYYSKPDGTRALIDGQQRMATLLLMLAALQALLKQPPQVMSKAIRDIDPNGLSDDPRFRIELQYSEVTSVLEKLCSGKRNELTPGIGGPRYFLVHAYDKCLDQLSTELGDDHEEELTEFFKYLWRSTHVVTIETPDLKSAYKIFETLNDRGKALNASDLLRNYLFRSSGSDRKAQLAIQSEWKTLTDTLRTAGEGTQVRFLRYYLMATYGLTSEESEAEGMRGRDAVIRADGVFDWITRNEGLLEAAASPETFARRLSEAAGAYAQFLAGCDGSGKKLAPLENIGYQRTGVRQHLCLLLAGRQLPAKAFRRLAEAIESLTLAFAVAGVPWNTLEKKLPGWSSKIRSCGSVEDVDKFVMEEIQSEIATHATKFWEQIDSIYTGSPSLAKYVLARLTHLAQTSAVAGGSMGQLMASLVSVEHILPRSIKDPDKPKEANWLDFGVTSQEAALPYVEKLGNLCLVDWGINSQLSDHTYAGPPEDAPPTYVVKRDRLALVPWLLTRVIAATVAPDKKKLNAKVSAGQDKFIEKYRLAPPVRRWNADEVDRRHRYLRQMISDVWPLLPRPEEKKAEPGTAVHEPNAEELILQLVNKGESSHREFKASFRYDYDEDRDNKSLVTGPIRTTAAFMNSGGGTLLVGVADDGTVLGLDRDLELSTKGSDGLERFYRQSLVNAIGAKFAHGAFAEFVSVEGKTICRIDVDPSPRPVFIERKIEGRIEKDFFIREGGSTRALDLQQAHEYIELHW